MNKNALKRNVGQSYRIRPRVRRFKGGPGGLPLPPVDDLWVNPRAEDKGIWIENPHTGHGTLLEWDQIYDYRSGFLNLKVQLNIGGDRVWIEPISRPGQELPDQFSDVRDWKREDDPIYVQSVIPAPRAQVAQPPAANNGLTVLFALCLGIGIGVLAANE